MEFADYLRAHRGFFRVLTLQLGLKCPLSCRHCLVEAGPDRVRHMSAGQVSAVIRQYAALDSSEIVMLTGGEPFLYRKQLVAALGELATHQHVSSYVITSAYWATSRSGAVALLRRLPPIDLLSVSADIYHEEFVSIECVRNALLACESLGIGAALCVCLDKDDDDAFVQRLRERLGNELFTKYLRWSTPVLPEGRGAEVGEYPKLYEEAIPPIICHIVGAPVMLPDGTVTSCCDSGVCNHAMDRPEWGYNFGRVPVRGMREIRDVMNRDPVTQGLRVLGPARLLKILHEAGAQVDVRVEYLNICDLCRAIMDDSSVVDVLRRVLTSPAYAREIKLSRLLHYGELPTLPTSACPSG